MLEVGVKIYFMRVDFVYFEIYKVFSSFNCIVGVNNGSYEYILCSIC